jgi:dihydrofolate reductase
MFARIWPNRTDEFATKWNTVPKLVASRSLTDVDGWQNSSLIEDDLVTTARRHKAEQAVIVSGSVSVVHTLADHDLVDEYRIMVFPTVVGKGQRLFPEGTTPADLQLSSVEQKGAAVLLRYRRSGGHAEPTA